MDPLMKDRAALLEQATKITDGAKGRDLRGDEIRLVEGKIAEIKQLDERISARARGKGILDALEGGGSGVSGPGVLDLGRKGLRELSTKIAGGVNGSKAMGGGAVITDVPVLPEITADGRIPTGLLDVIPVRRATTPSWRYLAQSVRDLKAAAVAPGDVKPTSDLQVVPVDNELSVIAHLSGPIDEFQVKDSVNLERFISAELDYGIRVALEAQIASGDGLGPNLLGLLERDGIQSIPFAADLLTTTRKAVTALESAGLAASVFVFSPADWEALELLQRDGSGAPSLGAELPVQRAARTLWGVPVAVSNAVTEATAMLIDASSVELVAGTLSAEWGVLDDDFSKNQRRLRAEMRAGIDVFRPFGIVQIALA